MLVSLPDTIIDAKKWSTTLDNEGSGQIQFTLLAYLLAGLPSELRLYGKGTSESGEPSTTFSFIMKDFVQQVNVGVEGLSLDEIIGSYAVTVYFDGDEQQGAFSFSKSGTSLIAIDKRGNTLKMSYDPATGTAFCVQKIPNEDDEITLETTFVFRLENGIVKMSGKGVQSAHGRSQSAQYEAHKID